MLFLKKIDKCWQDHCRQMVGFSSLFSSLSDQVVTGGGRGAPAPYKHQCLFLMVCYGFTDNDKEYFLIFGSHLCSTKLDAAVNLVSHDDCLLV